MAARPKPHVAIPRAEDLAALSPSYRKAFADTVSRLNDVDITEIDISPLLDAARLLYDGAIVAERYAAVGDFVVKQPQGLDPTVAEIISKATELDAVAFANDVSTLTNAKAEATKLLAPYDALLLPTTTEHPNIEAVAAEPLAINRRLGTYTNFCNLLDLAAVAVPGNKTDDDLPFGVMFIVDTFADQRAIDLAARLLNVESPAFVTDSVPLAVFGAHLRGQPLNWQLDGARFAGEIRTTDAYRLTALQTTPPKPGLVRHGDGQGAEIYGELFELSPAHLGRFLADLPAPMALTSVELADGRTVTGFACTYDAALAADDITHHGSWLTYLAAARSR
ncbi:hypothetical protein GCM10011591_36440 [Nocardia camponoti]|uniref:Allophanate hydrolase n=1 Tax=Nocardia camponoti TaxID=1616106 RepID=A0A917VBV3_9NOCA|nr:hypothetical protein GCM10011591_36440 [Nocardia camponoti]